MKILFILSFLYTISIAQKTYLKQELFLEPTLLVWEQDALDGLDRCRDIVESVNKSKQFTVGVSKAWGVFLEFLPQRLQDLIFKEELNEEEKLKLFRKEMSYNLIFGDTETLFEQGFYICLRLLENSVGFNYFKNGNPDRPQRFYWDLYNEAFWFLYGYSVCRDPFFLRDRTYSTDFPFAHEGMSFNIEENMNLILLVVKQETFEWNREEDRYFPAWIGSLGGNAIVEPLFRLGLNENCTDTHYYDARFVPEHPYTVLDDERAMYGIESCRKTINTDGLDIAWDEFGYNYMLYVEGVKEDDFEIEVEVKRLKKEKLMIHMYDDPEDLFLAGYYICLRVMENPVGIKYLKEGNPKLPEKAYPWDLHNEAVWFLFGYSICRNTSYYDYFEFQSNQVTSPWSWQQRKAVAYDVIGNLDLILTGAQERTVEWNVDHKHGYHPIWISKISSPEIVGPLFRLGLNENCTAHNSSKVPTKVPSKDLVEHPVKSLDDNVTINGLNQGRLNVLNPSGHMAEVDPNDRVYESWHEFLYMLPMKTRVALFGDKGLNEDDVEERKDVEFLRRQRLLDLLIDDPTGKYELGFYMALRLIDNPAGEKYLRDGNPKFPERSYYWDIHNEALWFLYGYYACRYPYGFRDINTFDVHASPWEDRPIMDIMKENMNLLILNIQWLTSNWNEDHDHGYRPRWLSISGPQDFVQTLFWLGFSECSV